MTVSTVLYKTRCLVVMQFAVSPIELKCTLKSAVSGINRHVQALKLDTSTEYVLVLI
jgi:hypothetical protein